jgi:hypothetical protein
LALRLYAAFEKVFQLFENAAEELAAIPRRENMIKVEQSLRFWHDSGYGNKH